MTSVKKQPLSLINIARTVAGGSLIALSRLSGAVARDTFGPSAAHSPTPALAPSPLAPSARPPVALGAPCMSPPAIAFADEGIELTIVCDQSRSSSETGLRCVVAPPVTCSNVTIPRQTLLEPLDSVLEGAVQASGNPGQELYADSTMQDLAAALEQPCNESDVAAGVRRTFFGKSVLSGIADGAGSVSRETRLKFVSAYFGSSVNQTASDSDPDVLLQDIALEGEDALAALDQCH